MTENIRDNLLVTMATRAAYMHSNADITLPGGSDGEDILAHFVAETVNSYMDAVEADTLGMMNFDEYIERALLKAFSGDGSSFSRTLTIEYEKFIEEDIAVLSVVDETSDSVLNMFRGKTAEELYEKLTMYVEPEEQDE